MSLVREGEYFFNDGNLCIQGWQSCASCHPGDARVDGFNWDLFYTPTLVEVWRTAPYLHDGSAATIQDVLTTRNPNNEHGVTKELTEQELNDLCEYVLSL